MVNKLERNGEVAVLYSPGFGAGWSTWSYNAAEAMAFDPEVAQAILDGDKIKAGELAKAKWPDEYFGGLDDLKVKWLPRGTQFQINEYDGSESIQIISPAVGFVA